MILNSNKFPTDTFVFDPLKDRFKYLRTNILYNNTVGDINTLLSIATIITPISGGPTNYYGSFTVPPSVDGEILYLIWDFRSSLPVQLCYSAQRSPVDVCCDCSTCNTACVYIKLDNSHSSTTAEIDFPSGLCGSENSATITLDPGEVAYQCVNNNPWEIALGNPIITIESCICLP